MTLAVITAVALAGIASAQGFDPNTVRAAPTNAPIAGEEEFSPYHRGFVPPGPPPVYERICVWRSDGAPVTGRFQRVGANVTFSNCPVNQHRAVGASCQCDGHPGNVVEVPV